MIAGYPPILEVVIGDIDAQIANLFLEECAGCARQPEIVEHSGLRYYSWGPDQDLRSSFGLPLFDEFGQAEVCSLARESA